MSELTTLSLYIENPDNPQTVTDKAFADLVKSIKDCPETLAASKIAYATDYVSPISGKDYSGKRVVMAGNKRLRALKKIRGDLAQVPAEWFFDLTPLGIDARRKWLVRSNIQTGEWDSELLAKLYTQDELRDIMSAEMLDELLGSAEASPESGKTDEDAVPELNEAEPPVSRRGSIYLLGDHRLMCGDSTSVSDVAALMGGQRADLLITDPPYNVDYKGAAGKIKNDSMSADAFRDFLTRVFAAADTALRDGGVFYVWHADLEGYNFRGALMTAGWKIRQCLVWVKDSLVLGRADYQWKHEPCLYGWKEGEKHLWRSDRRQTSAIDLVPEKVIRDGDRVRFHVAGQVFECAADVVFEVVDGTVIPLPKPTASKLHPTMKPVKLFAYQIRNSSREGDLVLDLFGGSGTTVIACEQSHRRARLMELDEKFVDVIRRRWAEYKYGEGCDWKALTPEEERA